MKVQLNFYLQLPFPFWSADKVYLNNIPYEFEYPATAVPCKSWNRSGLRYEAIEVRKCLKAGKLESDRMSHKDSILLATIMDEIRKQVGVKYDVD